MIKTRCSAIDDVLEGGFKLGEATEVYGRSGVGKTQLCLQLALSVQLPVRFGGVCGKALFLVSPPTFPSRRLNEIASHFPEFRNPTEQLKNVNVRFIDSAYELNDVVNSLKPFFEEDKNTDMPTKLVVIDSIYSCFLYSFPDTKDGRYMRSVLLRAMSYGIKVLANSYNICFVICNTVPERFYYGPLDAVKAAPRVLGKHWAATQRTTCFMARYWDDAKQKWVCILNITGADDIILRQCNFAITSKGISPATQSDISSAGPSTSRQDTFQA